jgi:hypothetical protein
MARGKSLLALSITVAQLLLLLLVLKFHQKMNLKLLLINVLQTLNKLICYALLMLLLLLRS